MMSDPTGSDVAVHACPGPTGEHGLSVPTAVPPEVQVPVAIGPQMKKSTSPVTWPTSTTGDTVAMSVTVLPELMSESRIVLCDGPVTVCEFIVVTSKHSLLPSNDSACG